MTAAAPPLLAITMGDAAGTGPEIITKALGQPEVRAACRPLVVGDAGTMRQALEYTGAPVRIRAIREVAAARFASDEIDVLDLRNIDVGRLMLGKVNPMAGKAAFEYVKVATELALVGAAEAVVTSALNKAALNQAGFRYNGHTEILAELCRAPDATMMLVVDRLRVSHVSTHVPLRVAIERVRPERILKVLRLTDEAMRNLGVPRPKLAVAGLNPHAGENGLFGDEEATQIAPAIAEARRLGLDAAGPFAGDTIFFRTLQGEFDAAVAMYHDQGHVAAKMLGLWRGVNVTLGLPIIRTSVEHGTNFDLAGTGRSDPRSLIEAIRLAATLARNRQK
jgi:4-hydroxythreonine-4-phosphate dehydrogenase